MTVRSKVPLYHKGVPVIYERGVKTSSGKIRVNTFIPDLTIRKIVATGKGAKTVINKPITNASGEEEIAHAGVAVKYLIDIQKFDTAKRKLGKMKFGTFQSTFFRTWKTKHFLDFLIHFMGTSKKTVETFKALQRSSLIDLVVNYSRASSPKER